MEADGMRQVRKLACRYNIHGQEARDTLTTVLPRQTAQRNNRKRKQKKLKDADDRDDPDNPVGK
jgi:hypothetical protein